ncbi:MAG TPA: PAS domain S-box protein [Verrucomicrobiae bacterium]|jgi:PAS domain S-box-containing protein|nr:PAS domain S-box protein [Verrucomicrobiae bacterium]
MDRPFGQTGQETASSASRSVAETLLSSPVLEAIPDALVAVNQQGVIIQVNSQTEAMFGYTHDELVGQSIEMLVPEAHRSQHSHHRQQFHEKPKIRRMGSGLDLRGRRRDGTEFPVEISLSPLIGADGTAVLSVIRDISDRKRIEEELRHANEELERRKARELRDSQNRMALIMDSSQDAIIGKNLDGIITQWNKGAEQIYGYNAAEVIGRSIQLLAPKDRAEEIPEILRKIRAGERVEYFETTRVTRDGRRLNMSVSVSPIYNQDGKVIGASTIARNITAQKKIEEQLRQSQKMEAVGRLAGGVAHDFNNLLGIVTACTELLRVHANAESIEYIDNIREAAKRGAALTRQLLAFGRRQQVQVQVLDLNERLKEVSKLLRPLMGDDVQVTILSRSPGAIVEGDPIQMDQIVMNLAVNARDAMPKGGKLIIETGVFDFDESFAREHPGMNAGRYVLLAVSDNGIGMNDATRSRIFEPFFTTKETGKGTGLGLSTVYGIVKQIGGHIWVYSEPDRGTTFKIYLPSADHKLDMSVAQQPEALPPRREGTIVLLAEDDSMMRRLTREILEKHGYKVLEAEDGKAALEVVAQNHQAIDLVLTDVVMKGMNGPEMVLRLLDRHPAMKVVYMSGYTGELVVHNGGDSGIRLLEKPFTRSSLLKTIDAALE